MRGENVLKICFLLASPNGETPYHLVDNSQSEKGWKQKRPVERLVILFATIVKYYCNI